ncbi:ATP-binding cassette domain-containing protein, partial [Streptococcus suis]
GGAVALNNVNLKLTAGKIIGLLGPNGSGKTTLIKLINGLLQPEYGQVLINGRTPSPETKAIVSYLPDTTYLDESMKVSDAITFFTDFYADFDKERAL